MLSCNDMLTTSAVFSICSQKFDQWTEWTACEYGVSRQYREKVVQEFGPDGNVECTLEKEEKPCYHGSHICANVVSVFLFHFHIRSPIFY